VGYTESEHNYTAEERASKERIVREFLERNRPAHVLDAGCNTGHFSRIAATSGAAVVAIDRDPDVIDHLWNATRRDGLNILPMVIDIARPSAAWGWANGECLSFPERAQGKFDCVLMPALIHHLVVSERIPLDRIFELLARMPTGTAHRGHWRGLAQLSRVDQVIRLRRVQGPRQTSLVVRCPQTSTLPGFSIKIQV
jgi:SAM-dependent methyltransferase